MCDWNMVKICSAEPAMEKSPTECPDYLPTIASQHLTFLQLAGKGVVPMCSSGTLIRPLTPAFVMAIFVNDFGKEEVNFGGIRFALIQNFQTFVTLKQDVLSRSDVMARC
ncbi:hypothetical protein CEXT_124771 [Caerostris extrusa]|uniref:Uncharacterized protein n=1 Tax=Caerostris extrusa TaxID=172846 RepID=A0AAV4QLZ9_CAEEX|nr:hypothetical protein CEXT_124771 [Caerostris extrusa]